MKGKTQDKSGQKIQQQKEGAFPKAGAPAERALESAGIRNLAQLAKLTEREVLDLHGIGPKAFGILKEVLKAKGLTFKK